MLENRALDMIFREARTHNGWLSKPVSDDTLRQLYELMKWGPTSANCSPARILFIRTQEAKERLKPALSSGNRDKTMAAPVTALVAYDLKFYDLLPKLFPHDQKARSWFTSDETVARMTAIRNGTLQGAYMIIAARALGLDCGPMSGFDNEAVDREFFPGGQIKSNFICALGHGDQAGLFPRSPRPNFGEVCSIV